MDDSTNVDSGIQRLEAILGRRLPDDYRIFLQNNNGGIPSLTNFAIPQISSESSVGTFYGIGVRPQIDIFNWLEELNGKLPKNWIPIGRDRGGNVLLMDLSTEIECKVLFWDAICDFPESTDADNTYFLADSFSQFLNTLH